LSRMARHRYVRDGDSMRIETDWYEERACARCKRRWYAKTGTEMVCVCGAKQCRCDTCVGYR
jgi:hypothetical protein